MGIVGFDHILIAIPDGSEAEALAFYCTILGFTERDKPTALAGRGGAWLQAGAAILHLGSDPKFTPPGRAHPGFLVENLSTMIAHLAAAGAELRYDVPLPGYNRVHTRDPFGNRLELLEKTGD